MLTTNKHQSFRRLITALFLVVATLSATAQERFTPVDADDLIHSPQRYWAQAIMFRDVLVAPAKGSQLSIENRRYTEFTVKKLGACYASQDLVPLLDELPLNREYAFSGSVFQYRGRFYIIAQGATPVASTEAMYRELRASADETAVDDDALKPISEILWKVQAEHMAYAKERKIPLCQLYDPTSEHYARALDITRSVILDEEQKSKTISAEILANYIGAALAKSCPPPVTTSAPPPAPEPAAAVEPQPEPVKEKPAKRERKKARTDKVEPAPEETVTPPTAPAEPEPETAPMPEPVVEPTPAPPAVEPPPPAPQPSPEQVSEEEERARHRQKKAALKAEEERMLEEQRSVERAKRIESSLIEAELDYQKALEREQALPPAPKETPAPRRTAPTPADTPLPLYR